MPIYGEAWSLRVEKEMATHFSILAWKTPWTEESGGVRHDLVTEHAHTECEKTALCTQHWCVVTVKLCLSLEEGHLVGSY